MPGYADSFKTGHLAEEAEVPRKHINTGYGEIVSPQSNKPLVETEAEEDEGGGLQRGG